jgi:hypothetical protein
LPVTLRPQGFSPSRRLAPPTACRACFIPVPLMGFALRGFAPPGAAPYALSNAVTLMRLTLQSRRTSTSGLNTQPRVPTTGPVFSRVTASDTSLGFFPSEASCQKSACSYAEIGKQSPSRALTARPMTVLPSAPQGTTTSDAVILFRELHCPLGVSHLVDHLESSKVPQRTGY